MALYEHTSGERIRTVHNSHEDNRLGMAAMDPASGWSLVDETPAPPATPAPPVTPLAPAPAVVAAPEPAAPASTPEPTPAPEPEAA